MISANAMAYSSPWYTSSSPLTAYDGNGSLVAQAYGAVHGSGYPDTIHNDSYQRDPRSNGIGVTVKNNFCFDLWPTDGCSGNKQTTTTSSSSWIFYTKNSGIVSSAANAAYDKIQACQNVNNAPVDCSITIQEWIDN